MKLLQDHLPPNDGTLRFMLLGVRRNDKATCSACGFKIRDRRPGPVKANSGVCIDRLLPDGTYEAWVAFLCKGCGVKHYGWPAKTLKEIAWPDEWTESTNVR